MSTHCFIPKRALNSGDYFKWMIRRYFVVLAVLFVLLSLAGFWGELELKNWFEKTDKFALFIQFAEVVLLVSIALYTSASQWKAELPLYQTVIFQDISGRPLFIVPYIPLTAMGDVRQQAQAALKSWNDNANLPIDQMLYDIIEQGVWVDKENIVNKGRPFNHVVTVIRKNNLDEKAGKLKAVFQPEEGKVRIGIHQSKNLCVSKGIGEVSVETAQNWLDSPQCLPPIKPVWENKENESPKCSGRETQRANHAAENKENESLKCSGKCYIVTRHEATLALLKELLKEKLGLNSCEHLNHLDEASLVQLNKGDCVFGNLPFALVKALSEKQVRYFNLDIDLPESERGKELSKEALAQFNPRVTEYRLQKVSQEIPLK